MCTLNELKVCGLPKEETG